MSSTQVYLDPESPTSHKTRQRLEVTKSAKATALHKVKGGKITKPSSAKSKKRNSFWRLPSLASYFGSNEVTEGDNLDGDTIVDDDAQAKTTFQDNDLTLVADEEEELQDKSSQATFDTADFSERTEDESWLLTRINCRGREPLFLSPWFYDFAHFPHSVFTGDPTQVIISKTKGSSFRAIKAFDTLLKAGPQVRGQMVSGVPPERPLFKAIIDYHKWTLYDGKLDRKAHIPVTAIISAKPREPTESAVNRVTSRLHKLARQYRDKWRDPSSKESEQHQKFTHPMPTLVGFVVKFTVSAIVVLDSRFPKCPIHVLHTGDWNVVGQEAWHAMAIGIAFVRQRDWLMGLDEEGELGEEIIDEGSDPDA